MQLEKYFNKLINVYQKQLKIKIAPSQLKPLKTSAIGKGKSSPAPGGKKGAAAKEPEKKEVLPNSGVTVDQVILLMIRCEKMYNAIEMITTILK